MRFTYLEKYGGAEVRRSVVLDRRSLKPGKWFYLRAPKVFTEKIIPKLTHKLSNFAVIKRGFTTGANDFFYMKDITHLYESDSLIDPKKFEDWRVTSKTRRELEKQGLIYIENEGGEKFVINKKDVIPIIRSPKQLGHYLIDEPETLCLYIENPDICKYTKRYIEYGEKKEINKRPTLKNRKIWYKLSDLEPTNIILIKSFMNTIYTPFSEKPVLCDQRSYTVKTEQTKNIWLYFNSVIFYIIIELFCRRLGGGASDIAVDDYKQMLVPDLYTLNIEYDYRRLNRPVLVYYKEIEQQDRRDLDIAVLKALGFEDTETIVDELYSCFIEVVEDRIIKADQLLKRFEEEEYDEDN